MNFLKNKLNLVFLGTIGTVVCLSLTFCAHNEKGSQGQFSENKFHEFHGLYFMGQPEKNTLKEMKDQNIKVVINLQTNEELKQMSFDAAKEIETSGMTYYHFPWDPTAEIDSKQIEQIEKTVMTYHKKGEKVALFCKNGNRGAAWFSTHVAHHHKDNPEKALEMGRKQGLNNPQLEAHLMNYFKRTN